METGTSVHKNRTFLKDLAAGAEAAAALRAVSTRASGDLKNVGSVLNGLKEKMEQLDAHKTVVENQAYSTCVRIDPSVKLS